MIKVVPRAAGPAALLDELVEYLRTGYFWQAFPSLTCPDRQGAAMCLHVLLLRRRLGCWPQLRRCLEQGHYGKLAQIANPHLPAE
jgi:hypothetical protein